MSVVYSTRFLDSHSGSTALYTVPAGYRAVVRSITAFNGSALIGENAQVVLLPSLTTIWQATLSTSSWAGADLHVVINELEQITLNEGPDVDMTVSGYLLSLP